MEKIFIRFANRTAKWAGNPWTFVGCFAVVLLWAASGPVFGFGETWQLVINTGTTIVTFLMVFLIQNTQNRDACAMHAKLDELIYAVNRADARFIGIEHLTERELDAILAEVERRALAVHAGEPAGPIRGRRASRVEEIAAEQPKSARAGRAPK
ncbi:low affinity iron permease family protein [Brevundimonas sp.]|uniref:low affinity iron permease family protein n=1 Tax=Brevundimonas sp. TaxID=1871086 RepID=UPI000DB68FAB|nr:low affinity iron permease family protein [Brevundimonas sp.]PZU01417.1 MAG: low affinity iron permease family protein [Brevundimonas sp.]